MKHCVHVPVHITYVKNLPV